MKHAFLLALIIAGSAVAAAQSKIAYINSATIMGQLTEAQDAQKQLDALSTEWQNQLTKMGSEIQQKMDDYDKRKLIMSDKKRAEVEAELRDLDKKLVEFRTQKFGTDGELFTKQNELMKPVQEKIFKAVKDVADEEGYDYVIDRSSSTLLLYANEKNDLTQKVLEKLQQK